MTTLGATPSTTTFPATPTDVGVSSFVAGALDETTVEHSSPHSGSTPT